MKIFKKLAGATLLVLIFLALGYALNIGKNHVLADTTCSGICGFKPAELTAASGGSAFHIHQSGTTVTIVGNIKHNGTTYTVTFSGSTPTNTHSPIPFENNSNFCKPNPGDISDPSTMDPASRLWVLFDNVTAGSLHGKITKNGNVNSFLWPGLAPGNPTDPCGVKDSKGKVSPINIEQDPLVQDSAGGYTGPGAKYTLAKMQSAQFKFDNAGVITMHFQDPQIADIKFVDSDPDDTDHNFKSQTTDLFCNGTNTGTSGGQIDFTDGPTLNFDPQIGTLTAGYIDGSDCVKNGKIDMNASNPLDSGLAKGSGHIADEAFIWVSADKIQNIDCDVSSASCGPGDIPMNKVLGAPKIFHKDSSACGGFALVLDEEGGNTGKFNKCPNGAVRHAVILGAPDAPPTTCSDGSLPPCPPPPPGGGGGGGTGGGNNSDEVCFSSGWALSWLACPLISAMSSMSSTLYSFIEDQLQFKIPQSLGGEKNNVQSAWNNFRILVTGLVVILMLVMVISQSLGGGPFDAYTIRKMLPRLVIGVILIQLSYPLFSWVINVVDDLARSIADIIYAPFGGASAMTFVSIMHQMGTTGAGIATAFNWLAIPAIVILGFAAPFLVLAALISALLAIVVGFLTLLFRKILIILALIFAPVALIAWTVPSSGVQKYWKIWWDNFIKVLMMFPLIVLMIAGGRIFAKIGAGQSDIVGFFIVLVGFFGPLFILPKTYKWGGSLMSMGGDMIAKTGTSASKAQRGVLKTRNERYQGASGNKYNPDANIFRRAFRRTQTGNILPTERSRRLAIYKGDKWANDRNDEAGSLVNRRYENAVASGYKGLTGVAAGKQILLDIAGQDTSGLLGRTKDVATRASKMAAKQFLDTSSYIEAQTAKVSEGKNKGRRFAELGTTRSALVGSPQHYSAMVKGRPDMTPDVYDSAESLASKMLGKQVRYETTKVGSDDYKALEQARMSIAMDRLTPDQVRDAHFGLFEDIGELGAMKFVRKDADGNPIVTTGNLSETFRDKLLEFKGMPGNVGRDTLASLAGGKRDKVDKALAEAHTDLGRVAS